MAYVYLSLALLTAAFSLAASLTFLLIRPDNQNDAMRWFNVCWVAISGAVLWLVISIFLVRLIQHCRKRGEHSKYNTHRRDTSEERQSIDGRPAFKIKISRPIEGSFIHFQAEQSNSIPSTISSATSLPETPTHKPLGSSRFGLNIITRSEPDTTLDLPSIFSPFKFHPPDDETLYQQHGRPARSDSLAALLTPSTSTIAQTLENALPMPFHATDLPPRTPSPVSHFKISPMVPSKAGSSPALPAAAYISPISQKSPVSDEKVPPITVPISSPSENAENQHQSVVVKRLGKSLPSLPEMYKMKKKNKRGEGDWYRCHLSDGVQGHYMSSATI